jgi:hypothetical protein
MILDDDAKAGWSGKSGCNSSPEVDAYEATMEIPGRTDVSAKGVGFDWPTG